MINGEQTQDLRHRIANADKEARAIGRRCLIAGLILFVTTLIAALVAAIIASVDVWTDNDGQMFAVLVLVTLVTLAGTLVLVGGFEYRQQAVLARHDQDARDIDTVRILVERLTIDVQDLRDVVNTMPDRLGAVEDGIQSLVETLPEEVQRKYWAGFNDAVKEGFRATGTDGPQGGRPRRIGLVPPED